MPRTKVGYRLHHEEQEDDDSAIVWVDENPALVLLGGEVWPASFIVCEHVSSFLRSASGAVSSLNIVELGAGTGLCGLVALATALECVTGSVHCFLTDESPALSEVNLNHFETTWQGKALADASSFSSSSSSFPSNSITAASSSLPPSYFSAHALELSWGGDSNTLPSSLVEACQSAEQVLILGSEISPMLQTQAALIETVLALLTVSSLPAGSPSSSLSSSPSTSRPSTPCTATSSSYAALSPKTAAVAVLTIDACVSGTTYPSTCPHPKPCAGHRFIKLVEARGGMRWDIGGVWSVSELQEACRRRRRRRRSVCVTDGSDRTKKGVVGETGRSSSDSREFAVTAPEGLVIVHISLEA